MIDTHCHLAAKEFDADREEVIVRARAAGVGKLIVIADSLEESRAALALAEGEEGIFCTVGVHPHNASSWRQGDQAAFRELAGNAKVVAIGEVGLDYHYDFSPHDVQKRVCEEQLILAKELALPAVVHSREALDDIWSILERVKPPKAVLHCCTEPFGAVARFLDAGYALSFTGIATYPKSQEIRETIRQCPLSQLMIETDAPYLAPLPHRGKRNEPAYVIEVAKCVAQMKGLSLQEVEKVTTENAVRFFGLDTIAV